MTHSFADPKVLKEGDVDLSQLLQTLPSNKINVLAYLCEDVLLVQSWAINRRVGKVALAQPSSFTRFSHQPRMRVPLGAWAAVLSWPTKGETLLQSQSHYYHLLTMFICRKDLWWSPLLSSSPYNVLLLNMESNIHIKPGWEWLIKRAPLLGAGASTSLFLHSHLPAG